jgi:hypothetical protein
MSDLQDTPKSNGLATVLNVVIAPKEALESIRVTPTWGWAFLIAEILVLIGSLMVLPAERHAFDTNFAVQAAKDPRFAQMPATQQTLMQTVRRSLLNALPIIRVLFLPILIFLQTLILLIFNALGRGSANFEKLWASVVNTAAPVMGLYYVVLGIVVMIQGPNNFATLEAIPRAMPSLALLIPNASPHLTAFLTYIHPFTIWSVALTILIMLVVARVSKLQAWLTGITSFLIPALFAAAFAR